LPDANVHIANAVVTSLSPDRGPQQGGILVNVIGSNFVDSNNLRCKFHDIVVKSTFVTGTQVQCISPPHHVSLIYVDVSNNIYEFTNNQIKFTVQGMYPIKKWSHVADTSWVTHILPVSGPSTGSTEVTVFGNAFVDFPQTQCKFGTSLSLSAVVKSSTRMLCTAPPHTEAIIYLEMTNNIYDYTTSQVAFEFYSMICQYLHMN